MYVLYKIDTNTHPLVDILYFIHRKQKTNLSKELDKNKYVRLEELKGERNIIKCELKK